MMATRQQQVERFNRNVAVGTAVKVWPGARVPDRWYEAVTISEAYLLGGNTAGVRIRKPSGGTDFIALTHVEAFE
jgi:hypothetical protein